MKLITENSITIEYKKLKHYKISNPSEIEAIEAALEYMSQECRNLEKELGQPFLHVEQITEDEFAIAGLVAVNMMGDIVPII